jgi:DNA-binding SARP family transcriptional activator
MIAEPNRDGADVGAGVTYPIQPGKVQPPALRDETLARTRLLDWLDVKIHRRVVFVIADAGYGKTTLLADFSRRSRIRTIWYRLDEEDRDWVGFLSHLVAAGREHDPGFAPRTASILRSLEPGGPTREDAIEAFIEELASIARDGAALILDDFHLADEVNDIRTIVREIVARGPERLSIVFASRRPPSIPVAKLRSLGELAELGIADLRFSDAELEQLFRETYGRPLEPDVLVELARRTEGWAASLTLVQAALRERTPAETRSFVRGLSGARDELHDYLAEEVVGDLPTIQQQFLMRTSLLQRVTPELAQVATGLDAVEVQSMITEAERLGLLGRRAKRRSSEQRYHPLVREFLEDRLRREIGPAGIDDLHVAVATWAEPSDWRTAAYHFAEARRWEALHRVLERHLDTILGTGAFAVASELIEGLTHQSESFTTEIIKSRIARHEGDLALVMQHAWRAHELAPNSELAINNLAGAAYFAGDVDLAMRLATELADSPEDSPLKDIAVAFSLMMEASRGADVGRVAAHLEQLAERHHASGHAHYEGVSLLNASLMHAVRGDAELALRDAARAADALTDSSSGSELASAVFARGWALAWLGRMSEARSTMREVGDVLKDANRAEYVYETGNLESLLGELSLAEDALAAFPVATAPTSYQEMIKATRLMVQLRRGEYESASRTLASIQPDVLTTEAGRRSKVMALKAYFAAITNDREAATSARAAAAFAAQQGASVYQSVASLALASVERRLNSAIVVLPERLLPTLSMCAELIVANLATISGDAMTVVVKEASRRPYRWRDALRSLIHSDSPLGNRVAGARLLDEIGELSDVATLRRLARQSRAANDRALGRGLARRLAATAFVSDLGRVRITVGPVEVQTGSVRRKVLALLCYLLTRPQMSATREEVMDALWPEIDPAAASNSLNQTIYFLRRVFEPTYEEETSPGYVRQESDLVFLDSELVVSTSRRCAALIAQIDRDPSLDLVTQLSEAYTDRFASDFAYEEWASDYREWLHVSYLQIVEETITSGIQTGQFVQSLPLARRALETDPRLETLGLSLLKLLKGSGAHAAAAEQYERYATLLRSEIGVDAPPFDSIQP